MRNLLIKNLLHKLLQFTFFASLAGSANAGENENFKWHGFASQAYLYSTGGNNIFGESTKGSTEYFEIGLGGQYRISPFLHVAGQLLARDAGATDNGSVRTDFLYVDYRIAQQDEAALGIRLGRVRNHFGFYNATRDVLFARPTILLPQMYLDANGIRELLFAADGVQLYGYWDHKTGTTTFSSTFGNDNELSSDTFDNIVGGRDLAQGKATLKNPVFAQLTHTSQEDRWKVAVSVLNTSLDFRASGGFIPSGTLGANIMALSVQRNLPKLTITAEYSLLSSSQNFGPVVGSTKSESLYVQGEYRASSRLSGLVRLDNFFGDRDHPNETDSLVLTIGGRWAPTRNWHIAAELHGIRGTNPIPLTDNPTNPLYARTELFVIMAGFRF